MIGEGVDIFLKNLLLAVIVIDLSAGSSSPVKAAEYMLECLYFAAIHRGHRSEHVINFLLLSLHNTHFPICAMLTNGALTKFRIQLYVEDMMLHDRYQVFTKYDLLSNISRIWLPHTPQPIRPLP